MFMGLKEVLMFNSFSCLWLFITIIGLIIVVIIL